MTDGFNWSETIQRLVAAYAERSEEIAANYAAALQAARDGGDPEELAELQSIGADGFAFTGEIPPGEIAAALDVMGREGFELPEQWHDWFEKLDDMIREHGKDPVLALALALDANSAAKLDADAFEKAFADKYRQQWDSAGDWARQQGEDEAAMGCETTGEARRAEAEFAKWANYVDWAAVAADPGFSDGYTLVELNGSGGSVHVIEDEA